MKYEIPIDNRLYYRAMLIILTCDLRLRDLEIEIVNVMLKNKISMLDTNCRKLIMKELNKDKFLFNNYVKRLKDKGVLIENNEKLYLNPNIIKAIEDKEITFKFTINE